MSQYTNKKIFCDITWDVFQFVTEFRKTVHILIVNISSINMVCVHYSVFLSSVLSFSS